MTTSEPPLLKLGEATHPGETGKNNEDRYGHITIPVADNASGRVTVLVVADGIGGQNAGEEASSLAVQTVKDRFMSLGAAANIPTALEAAIHDANAAIYEHSQKNDLLRGMGTTITAAVISDNKLYIANVGDSRVYLMRGETLTQLTMDHTWAQEAIEAKRLTPEEARRHPNRNVLKRYVGITESVEVDKRIRKLGTSSDRSDLFEAAPLTLEEGDTVLLNTDGLSDLVPDLAIRSTVAKNAPQSAADQLVKMARKAGGHDNITVLIWQYGKGAAGAAGLRRTLPIILGALALVVIAALTLFFLYRNMGRGSETPVSAPSPAIAQPASTPLATADALGSKAATAVTALSGGGMGTATAALGGTETAASGLSGSGKPTSTPAPTRTPVPTNTPRPTEPPARATSRPSAPSPSQPAAGGSPVQPPILTGPPDGEQRVGTVTFSWQASPGLPPGAGYDLVWWDEGGSAAGALSFGNAVPETSQEVNLAILGIKKIRWTVLVVQMKPYKRLTGPADGANRLLQVCRMEPGTCTRTVIDNATGENKTETYDCQQQVCP